LKTRRNTDIRRLATEQLNPASTDLDLKSSREIARIINAEDSRVAAAVKKSLPQIAGAIDLIADALSHGGRLIYIGTGTSGRIAALDAAELPPTFGVDPKKIQFVMAGGVRALAAASEADEDSRSFGISAVARKNPGKKDVIVGLSASGRTPFTIAALTYARRRGARTIAITCNRDSALEKAADLAIVSEVGPEVISGSTRMKAGTAQKMILNMLSTGAMVRLGYVYGNLMVNLRQKNSKMTERALMILQRATGLNAAQARRLLRQSGHNIPLALVMQNAGVDRKQAGKAIRSEAKHLRRAIAAARR
jgi:N-acetylmuramic acid 6-phosphate etherase